MDAMYVVDQVSLNADLYKCVQTKPHFCPGLEGSLVAATECLAVGNSRHDQAAISGD